MTFFITGFYLICTGLTQCLDNKRLCLRRTQNGKQVAQHRQMQLFQMVLSGLRSPHGCCGSKHRCRLCMEKCSSHNCCMRCRSLKKWLGSSSYCFRRSWAWCKGWLSRLAERKVPGRGDYKGRQTGWGRNRRLLRKQYKLTWWGTLLNLRMGTPDPSPQTCTSHAEWTLIPSTNFGVDNSCDFFEQTLCYSRDLVIK